MGMDGNGEEWKLVGETEEMVEEKEEKEKIE